MSGGSAASSTGWLPIPPGIGRQQPGWGGGGNQRGTNPSVSLGFATLVLARLRDLYDRKSLPAGGKTLHALYLSVPYSNLSQGRFLTHIGTKGSGFLPFPFFLSCGHRVTHP